MIKLKRIKLENLDNAKLNEQEMKQIVGGGSPSSIKITSLPWTPKPEIVDALRVTTPIYTKITRRPH